MKIVNLTPHALNIHGEGGVLNVAPSRVVARVATTETQSEPIEVGSDCVCGRPAHAPALDSDGCGACGGHPPTPRIPVVRLAAGGITGLPAPAPGTVYVVSGFVRATLEGRPDVYSPGPLVRDADGKPVGCRGLAQ